MELFFRGLVVILGTIFCLAAPLMAQTQADIDRAGQAADKILREEQLRSQEDIKRQTDRARPPAKIEIKLPGQDPRVTSEKCWDIHTIELKGVTLLSAQEQKDLLKPYTGQCLRLNDLNAILNDITRYYFAKGYVTSRAYIVQDQDISTGLLQILVIEGRLGQILLEDNRDGQSVAINQVFPAVVGKPLNLRDVEQGLEQANKLMSNNATIAIQPGEKPGESNLVVSNNAREPFTYVLGYNNQGSESTGKDQVTLSVFVDNPLQLSDTFGVTFRRTLPLKNNRYSSALNASYSIPDGYNTYSLSGGYSQFTTPILLSSGNTADFSGASTNISGTANRVLFRNQTSKLNGFGTLSLQESKSYFENSIIDVSSYNLTTLRLGLNYFTLLSGGLFDTEISYVRGFDSLGATNDPSGQAEGAPQAQFDKFSLSLGYTRPFLLGNNFPANFSSQFTGQYSPDVLYGTEQISVGGLYSVRGFPNISLPGNTGAYLRNELSITPVFLQNLSGFNENTSLFVAYDAGRIWGHYGGESGTLSGLAYGIRTSTAGWSFELMATEPLSYPSSIGKPDPYIYLQASTYVNGKEYAKYAPSIDEKNWFVGLEYGAMKFKLNDVYVANAVYNKENKEQYQVLKFGRKIGRSRAYVTLYNINEAKTFDYERYVFTFETKLIDAVISPFVGLSVGYASYEENDLDLKNPSFVLTKDNVVPKDNIKLSGLTYGAKLGLLYEGDNFSAGIFCEYAQLRDRDTLYFDGITEEFEMDAITSIGVSVNYKY